MSGVDNHIRIIKNPILAKNKKYYRVSVDYTTHSNRANHFSTKFADQITDLELNKEA